MERLTDLNEKVNEIHKKVDLESVKNKILWTLEKFIRNEEYLLKENLSERCITFNFACYLKKTFPKYNVDCEYNRNLNKVKKLNEIKDYINRELKECEEKDGINVSPDIIIHIRGTNYNIVVIEAKKFNSKIDDQKFDIAKIESFIQELGYKLGVFIKFDTGENCKEPQVKFFP